MFRGTQGVEGQAQAGCVAALAADHAGFGEHEDGGPIPFPFDPQGDDGRPLGQGEIPGLARQHHVVLGGRGHGRKGGAFHAVFRIGGNGGVQQFRPGIEHQNIRKGHPRAVSDALHFLHISRIAGLDGGQIFQGQCFCLLPGDFAPQSQQISIALDADSNFLRTGLTVLQTPVVGRALDGHFSEGHKDPSCCKIKKSRGKTPHGCSGGTEARR